MKQLFVKQSVKLSVLAAVSCLLVSGGLGASAQEKSNAPDTTRIRINAPGGSTLREIEGHTVTELFDPRIVHGATTITAKRALHLAGDALFQFFENVVISQETLRMWGDSGEYFQREDLAILRGNVRVEEKGMIVTADEARYNRKTGIAWLLGNVEAVDSSSTLNADRLFYDRDAGLAEVFGTVRMADSNRGFIVRGRHAFYYRDSHRGIVDRDPHLIVDPYEPEPITVDSDTMNVFPDSGLAMAHYRVKIIKGNMVTQCDSAVVVDRMKRVDLFGGPLARQDAVAMSGTKMSLFYDDDEVYKVNLMGKSRMVEGTADSLTTGRDNWIEGDSISLYLHDNGLDSLRVLSGASSEYYPVTRGRVESNYVAGDSMFFRFEADTIAYVRVGGKATGEYRYVTLTTGQTSDSLRAAGDSSLTYVPFLANAELVSYSARRIEYYAKNRELRLRDKSRIDYGGRILTGEQVTYFSELEVMVAKGDPVLKEGAQQYYGESMSYDLDTETGLVTTGSTQFEDGFYSGQSVARVGDNEMRVWNSVYTTCDLVEPHYHFAAKEMKVYSNDKIFSGPIWLYVGKTPLFYLPFMANSIRKGRHSGFLRPDFDFGVTGGGDRFIRNVGYYWATNDYMDFTVVTDFNEDNALASRVLNNYARRYTFNGRVDYRFHRSFTTFTNKWTVDATHRQEPINGYRFNTDVHFVSDESAIQSINRIDDTERYIDRSLRSNASLSKSWGRVGFGLTAAYTQNLFITDPTRVKTKTTLPNLSLTIPSLDLYFGDASKATGFLGNLLSNSTLRPSLSGSRVITKKLYESTDVINSRQGLSLSSPQRIGFITINPSIGANNSTVYTKYDTLSHFIDVNDTTRIFVPSGSSNKTVNDFSWSAGASASTNFYGTFYPRIGALRGVRHVLTPSARYTFSPGNGDRPRSQRITVALNNAFHVKLREAKPPPQAGRSATQTQPENLDQPGVEEEKLRKINNVIGWSLTASADPDADRGEKWSNVSSTLNGRLFGVNVTVRNTIDPYEWDVLNTTTSANADISIGGHHPFGRSTGVTVRKLNTVAAHDTSRSAREKAGVDLEYGGGQSGGQGELAVEEGMLPWSIRGAMTFTKTSNGSASSTLNLNSSIGLTDSWSITHGVQYDVMQRELMGHSIQVARDLHCWQMSLNRVQRGSEWQFYFTIQLKAHPDLKVEQGQRGLRGGGNFGGGFF